MDYKNWRMLTEKEIEQEWEWEYLNHWTDYGFYNCFEDFREAVLKGYTEKITKKSDVKIRNRSYCNSIDELKDLVCHYRFPRDVDRILRGFENNDAIPYPIIIETKDWRAVMSGNTRMDAAFDMGIEPVVLIIKPVDVVSTRCKV